MSRLSLYTIAEVIALTLIVVGGVLIFDRVESQQSTEMTIQNFALKGTFPGLFLCAMGALVVGWTVNIASQPGSRLIVNDLPVFVSDPNLFRNTGGVLSTTRPQTPKNATTSESATLAAPKVENAPWEGNDQ